MTEAEIERRVKTATGAVEVQAFGLRVQVTSPAEFLKHWESLAGHPSPIRLRAAATRSEGKSKPSPNAPARTTTPTAIALPTAPDCPHLGDLQHACPLGDKARDVHWCLNEDMPHGRCWRSVLRSTVADIGSCHGCKGNPANRKPKLLARFDQSNLFPELGNWRLNSSLIERGDGYAMAFRDGWKDSDIHIAKLDRQFRPITCTRLDLTRQSSNYGREDPRLWWHKGSPHVSFTGNESMTRGGKEYIRGVHVLFARLHPETFAVEDVFHPRLPGSKRMEKNWGFFDTGDGILRTVYGIAPHKILRIDCNAAHVEFETLNLFPWDKKSAGRRGGAAPIQPDGAGGEWWHFFHDFLPLPAGRRFYRTGLYTFSPEPPFRVLRQIPEPILEADASTNVVSNPKGHNYADCVFTCGAVIQGDRVILSSGVHDRWTEIHEFSRADLEKRLIPPP